MTVYVDDAVHPFGRMVMAHMVADTLAELHTMAERLGLKRDWFQCKAVGSLVDEKVTPHYDVSTTVRAKAIAAGAVAVDSRYIIRLARECRPGWEVELGLRPVVTE